MTTPQEKTVLVVDDEDDVRLFLCTVLEDEGFEVMSAADGEEAIECMKEKIPDFVSLDLVMPRKSGIRFLHECRRNREWSRVPVMIVTGHAHDELGRDDLEEAMQGRSMMGRGCYLEKPVNAKSFVSAVKRELGMEDYEAEAPTPPKAELKKELMDLVADADDETLTALRNMLKNKGH
jgi:CheY-like chemotaxis protein